MTVDRSTVQRIGIDSGGTFTDFTTPDGRVCKVPSDASASGRVIAEGVAALLPRDGQRHTVRIIHGTTVATNALLTGRLPPTAFLTTAGFRDILTIGRQNRPDLYALSPQRGFVPPPDDLVFEIPERLDAQGRVLTALDEDAVRAAAKSMAARGVKSAAIGFLHSFVAREHERRTAEILRSQGIYPVASADLVREYREFERFSTAYANAALVPILSAYVAGLGSHFFELEKEHALARPIEIFLLQSSGGLCSLESAAAEPVRLVLSGPAGGLVGAYSACGKKRPRLITFDIGGTSTDVALIDGALETIGQTKIADRPLLLPTLDVHTVGAGGGSIARKDGGGALIVGPSSAGANPGPAAYGRGGPITVTDANLFLGRIVHDRFLGGKMALDRNAAERAVERLAKSLDLDPTECAEGILKIAETTMARAVRTISLERGYDPRDFALVAFGGAGALHAPQVALALGIAETVVPVDPGLLSAKGMLAARAQTETSRTVLGIELAEIERRPKSVFAELEQRAVARLKSEGVVSGILCERFADLRFVGQSYELTVPFRADRSTADAFRKLHERRWGFLLDAEVEIVNVHVRALGPEPEVSRTVVKASRKRPEPWAKRRVVFDGRAHVTPIFEREALGAGVLIDGPAIVVEYSATTVVPPRHRLSVEKDGLLVIAATERTT